MNGFALVAPAMAPPDRFDEDSTHDLPEQFHELIHDLETHDEFIELVTAEGGIAFAEL